MPACCRSHQPLRVCEIWSPRLPNQQKFWGSGGCQSISLYSALPCLHLCRPSQPPLLVPCDSAIQAEHRLAAQLPRFDNRKARKELGLDFMDIRQSAQDMAASLLELGLVKARPGAPVSQFYSKL